MFAKVMPTPSEILDGLTRIAREGFWGAIFWHGVTVVVVASLALGWKPSVRIARALLSVPLLSVAGLAFAFGNPFNAAVFVIAAIVLGTLAFRGDPSPVRLERPWSVALGVVLFVFAWVYPHFLEERFAVYLIASPLGLIPCPTLSMVISAGLIGAGRGARAWSFTLAGLGLFYGVFGVVRLGVGIDVVLVLGSIALIASTLTGRVIAEGRDRLRSTSSRASGSLPS